MTDKPLDWTKPLRTRDGREVRIYDREAGGLFPVIGSIRCTGELWLMYRWTSAGISHANNDPGSVGADLVNTPALLKVDFWITVLSNGIKILSDSKEDARRIDILWRARCVARIHFQHEVEEGMFDE